MSLTRSCRLCLFLSLFITLGDGLLVWICDLGSRANIPEQPAGAMAKFPAVFRLGVDAGESSEVVDGEGADRRRAPASHPPCPWRHRIGGTRNGVGPRHSGGVGLGLQAAYDVVTGVIEVGIELTPGTRIGIGFPVDPDAGGYQQESA